MTDRASSQVRCEVHYSGRVQGVGFRFTAAQIASGYAVTGFVRNLSDGRVQLVAEGDKAEVERFLDEVADGMGGNISRQDRALLAATGKFTRFEVAR